MELVIGDATHGDGRGILYGSFAMNFLIQKYCHDRGHYFTWNIRLRIAELWMSGSQLLE